MRTTITPKLFIIISCIVISCQPNASNKTPMQLLQAINARLSQVPGRFAVAFQAPGLPPIQLNADSSFHAASTMKTPVLIEVYKQAAAGQLSLNNSVTVSNAFHSIVDSSLYHLNPDDDSEKELYKLVGSKRSLYQLVYDMIIKSSNLATNIVIERVGAKNVMATMRSLGAHHIQVLRGVEDSKAYQQGLNNTTTAKDLLLIFDKISTGQAVDSAASQAMINILLDQQFNEIIPARLPKDVQVAHKTSNISGVQHDSGIVILPDGRRYVLVLLSSELQNEQAGIDAMAEVSEMIYQYVVSHPSTP